jgi:hypothetical protein
VTLWLCVAPLRLGGLRGKKSTPSVWLGGTGEFIAVGKQEQEQLQGVSGRAGRMGFYFHSEWRSYSLPLCNRY